MRLRDHITSRFLRTEDIEKSQVVTIDRCELESMQEGEKPKPILYFRELQKGLVINKTNEGALREIFGTDDTDVFMGKKVTLYNDKNVMYRGQRTGGLRVREYYPPPPEPVRVREEIGEDG